MCPKVAIYSLIVSPYNFIFHMETEEKQSRGTCLRNNTGHAGNVITKKQKLEPFVPREMERPVTLICRTKSSTTSVAHNAATPTSSALQARVDGETCSTS